MKTSFRFNWLSFGFGLMAGSLLLVLWQGIDKSVSSASKTLAAVEPVFLVAAGRHLLARVDTGATTSSLSAHRIEVFTKEGVDWVHFSIPTSKSIRDGDGDIELQRPLVRYADIRQANQTNAIRRPVVVLTLEVQGVLIDLEFSLTDRSHLSYPVLLGRNLLQQGWLVDVNQLPSDLAD